jgi:uncharacterized membrane protein YgcG
MTKKYLLAILSLFVSTQLWAQGINISGRVLDKTDTSDLAGVTISIAPITDTNAKTGTITDFDGSFVLENIRPGQYRLQASYIGFNTYTRTIAVNNTPIDAGTINLQPSPTTLKNVIVQAKQVRAQQMGDTTQFNAGAYKTNPDASAEDLVTKMPGITTENGTLKVNGEDVKKILVDGKPFFGDDPGTAIKNLPAEVIDKIQVFDKMSDQSQFTGFDDGNNEKTINILTKPGKNNGQFGKIYAGYGTDDRYVAGGNVNFFKGDRRISLIGLSNNINQQNFSTEDLLGVVNSSSGGGRGGQSSFSGRGSGGSNSRGGRGSSDANNFLVGQQGGITATNAIGLNYSDNWGKKIKVSGSYFFNQTNNDNNTTLKRQYITATDSGLIYNENSITNTNNQNHRVSARIEYQADDNNAIIISPKFSLQNNTYTRQLTGSSAIANMQDSHTANDNKANNTGYNFSNDLLYRHKFNKKGRTLSLNIGTQLNNRTGDGSLYSLNEFVGNDTTLLDQEYDLSSNGYTLSSNIVYTEPVSDKGQVMINYSPSYTSNQSDKETYNLNTTENQYVDLDTLLSNKFDNTYTTHRGGISYRYNTGKLNLMAGVNGQYAILDGAQQFPYAFSTNRSFESILPNAMLNYKFDKSTNLRLMYRTSTNAPSISQLQNVVDNSNPLLLKTGNPSLQQSYEHRLILRYGSTNTTKATSFFAFVSGSFTNYYIANATFIPTRDTVFSDGIAVNRGSQLTLPVNMNGYVNTRGFLTYGFPVEAIKSNLNLNGGVSYTRAPSLINNRSNFTNTYNMNAGFTLGSNISEKVDFALTYTGNYNIAANTLQNDLDNTYYLQSTSLRFNWLFLDGFVLNTNLTHTLYTGLTQSFNQSFLLWNAGLGYKFLKDKSLEVKLSVYDILDQNRSLGQSITDTYIEESTTDVLQRYFMVNLTYSLRNFKKG